MSLSRLIIVFLLRSKHLLISWLQSPSAVILEPKKMGCYSFHFSPHLFAMKLCFLPWRVIICNRSEGFVPNLRFSTYLDLPKAPKSIPIFHYHFRLLFLLDRMVQVEPQLGEKARSLANLSPVLSHAQIKQFFWSLDKVVVLLYSIRIMFLLKSIVAY